MYSATNIYGQHGWYKKVDFYKCLCSISQDPNIRKSFQMGSFKELIESKILLRPVIFSRQHNDIGNQPFVRIKVILLLPH